uniref:Uncharacterized protein n=1 Tax=Anabas testudineus TaxID=64144 RepID=A0A3Q1HR37_ANATE
MCTTGDCGEIIILSDDDDEDDDDDIQAISCSESSVVIVEVEDVKKNDIVLPQSALDEDLVVTFSRRAEVLPHARYDYCEVEAPVASNQLFCDQCFCYICDKLASSCAVWSQSGRCHCNSHKKSDFWNNIRNDILLGGLKHFNLILSEIDTHLRQAGTCSHMLSMDMKMTFAFEKHQTESFVVLLHVTKSLDWSPFCLENMLQSFRQDLCALFSSFVKGKTLQEYVYEFVSSFLTKADKQNTRAAAIMRLGAAEEFIRHFQVSGYKHKETFPNLIWMCFSLCVRPWDDVLLMSVLKGQNVSGIRKDKGKKDVLFEQISVVLLRTELLQQQRRYRELYRYLRVIHLQQLQDLIPFFKCLDGDLMSAVHSLFPSVNAPATRLTPFLFLFYLRIFETATAPKLMVNQPAQLCCSDATWEPIKGQTKIYYDLITLPRVCFPLRTQTLSSVYPDQSLLLVVTGALCWRILNAPLSPALPVLNTFKVFSIRCDILFVDIL